MQARVLPIESLVHGRAEIIICRSSDAVWLSVLRGYESIWFCERRLFRATLTVTLKISGREESIGFFPISRSCLRIHRTCGNIYVKAAAFSIQLGKCLGILVNLLPSTLFHD